MTAGRGFVYILLAVALLVIQSALLPGLGLAGRMTPDLVVAMAAGAGAARGEVEGAWAGAIGGALAAVMAGRLWGVEILAAAGAGLAAGHFSRGLNQGEPVIPFLFGGAAAMAGRLLAWFVMTVAGVRPGPVHGEGLWIMGAGTGVAAAILGWLLRRRGPRGHAAGRWAHDLR